ncbi:MAG: hypothetical protein N3D81_03265, partial [Spirochaetes bacterium]|nr:hypothetical protein [Spirochaetota bacterium]
GMGDDTTNLSLVGRDLGGFYAEQRAKGYLWQIFLGSYFIDGSEGALNLSGGANVKVDVFEIEDIASFSLGLDGIFYSFGNNYNLVDYYDLINTYRIGIIPNKGFRTSETFNAYLIVSSDFASLYVKGGIIGQGTIQVSNNTINVYRENINANGIRFSGGLFSDFVEGIKSQVSGEYITLNVYTNTNVNAFYNSTRLAVNGKVLSEYELIIGGITRLLLEGSYVQEKSLNDVYRFIEYQGVDLAGQGRVSLLGGINAKAGLGFVDLFEFLGLSVVGSYQTISFKPEEFTSVKRQYDANIIEVRGDIDISFGIIGFEGFGINVGGRYFSWSDNLRRSRLLLNIIEDTKDISVTYISPAGYLYYRTDNMSIRLGYGYPLFGSTYDLDFGLVSDAIKNYLYKGPDGKFEGFYADYILQNLPRIYVDLKISF